MTPSNTFLARHLIEWTVRADLPKALRSLQFQEQAAQISTTPPSQPIAKTLEPTLSMLAKQELNHAISGATEQFTFRFFHPVQMTAKLQDADALADDHPDLALPLVASAWNDLPAITPPGIHHPRSRRHLNRYTLDNAFAGPSQTGWYHLRHSFAGTIAALQTLSAATHLQSLLQQNAQRPPPPSTRRMHTTPTHLTETRIEAATSHPTPDPRPPQI